MCKFFEVLFLFVGWNYYTEFYLGPPRMVLEIVGFKPVYVERRLLCLVSEVGKKGLYYFDFVDSVSSC